MKSTRSGIEIVSSDPSGEVLEGIPSPSFFSASAPQKIKEVSPTLLVTVPKKGTFSGEGFQLDFDISPNPRTVVFGDLLRAMLVAGAYPEMEPNQVFSINSVEVRENSVVVAGRIVEFVRGG